MTTCANHLDSTKTWCRHKIMDTIAHQTEKLVPSLYIKCFTQDRNNVKGVTHFGDISDQSARNTAIYMPTFFTNTCVNVGQVLAS